MTILGSIFIQGRTAGACGLIAAAHLGRNDGWIPAKDVAAGYGLSAMCMFNTMGGLYCEDLNAALGDGLITVYKVLIPKSWLHENSFGLKCGV